MEGEAGSGSCGLVEGGSAPCGRPHRQLEPTVTTDIIRSSFHAKKLAFSIPEFHL